MNDEQRRRQIAAICAQYKRMVNDGLLPAHDAGDLDNSRHLWASEVLGCVISTITTLSDSQLNALRDRLQGHDGKMLARVKQEFERCRIKFPDLWIARLAREPRFARWQGQTLATLPVSQLYRICKMLERRQARLNAGMAPRRSAGAGRAYVDRDSAAEWGLR